MLEVNGFTTKLKISVLVKREKPLNKLITNAKLMC